ncbi:hypothetical protein fh0823_24100 [Francisella halioticida]|uniref:iron-containing redox enzyme family protein n=1 Tax=Francisella halioticida TaxID=549298 RepID=UPI001AFB2B87|nr:iron-containing redox enzyme family protein [Francisella halioticida]BCD92271.1 hypothetical protein fh0823_24100 [Francisella halioticida]
MILNNYIDEIYIKYNLVYSKKYSNYATWLNTADKEHFLKTQIHFRFAVENFASVLAGVMSKIPYLQKRIDVANNIFEEHGNGMVEKSHTHTFIEFLNSINDKNYSYNINPCMAVKAFNESISNFVATHSYYEGAAMIGAIELLYIDISSIIAKHLKNKNWDKLCNQNHYNTHEVLDVEHAKELFNIVEPVWNNGCEIIKTSIKDSINLGAYLFAKLYQDLLMEEL